MFTRHGHAPKQLGIVGTTPTRDSQNEVDWGGEGHMQSPPLMSGECDDERAAESIAEQQLYIIDTLDTQITNTHYKDR